MKKIKILSSILIACTLFLCGCQWEKNAESTPTQEVAEGENQDINTEAGKEPVEESVNESATELTYVMEEWFEEYYAGEGENKEPLLMEAKMGYPVFAGGEEELTEGFNLFVQQEFESFQDSAIKSAEEAKEVYADFPDMPHPWSTQQTYNVTSVEEDYLSLSCDFYIYSGGAHGMYGTYGKVFDRKTGEEVSLADFVEQSGTEMEAIHTYLINECKRKQNEEGVFMWDDYEEVIRNDVAVDGSWYLTKDNLVIVAGVYTLASYADGEFTFEIPRDELPNLNSIDNTTTP